MWDCSRLILSPLIIVKMLRAVAQFVKRLAGDGKVASSSLTAGRDTVL